jgi:hypothetical protein
MIPNNLVGDATNLLPPIAGQKLGKGIRFPITGIKGICKGSKGEEASGEEICIFGEK